VDGNDQLIHRYRWAIAPFAKVYTLLLRPWQLCSLLLWRDRALPRHRDRDRDNLKHALSAVAALEPAEDRLCRNPGARIVSIPPVTAT
jgi:hypothetical protein